MKNNRFSPFTLLLALLALTALACRSVIPGAGSSPVVSQQVEAIVETYEPLNSAPALPDDGSVDLTALYERINPAVVNVTIYVAVSEEGVIASGQGSGFVYDNQGHILTNAHVVEGAEQIEIRFANGLIRQAELVGSDLNSDLAILQVTEMPEGIQALPLGDMAELQVGQNVIAIGNPFGLAGTLTRGVISALGRTIPSLTIFSIPQTIQTDAAINPGNSGGPLLNLKGEVIGVNAQIETADGSRSNSGVGFAIPVSIIRRVAPSLVEKGRYDWPYLGVSGSDLSYELIQGMELPVEEGAYVYTVVDGGPADKAGLRGVNDMIEVEGRQTEIGGDVIIAINGQTVESFDDMLVYLSLQTSPGDTITLTILRDGKQSEVQVTLAARPRN